MKYLAIIFTLVATAIAAPLSAQPDAITKYFDQYVEDERFTVVYISPKMFQLFDKLDVDMEDEEAEAIKSVVKDLRSLRILVAEESGQNFYKEATSMINTKEYEVLMNIRNKGEENVDFLIKDAGETIEELLLIVGSPDEFVLMSFVGNIDLDNISKLVAAFEDDDEDDDVQGDKPKY
jgi:hypothetical protein